MNLSRETLPMDLMRALRFMKVQFEVSCKLVGYLLDNLRLFFTHHVVLDSRTCVVITFELWCSGSVYQLPLCQTLRFAAL